MEQTDDTTASTWVPFDQEKFLAEAESIQWGTMEATDTDDNPFIAVGIDPGIKNLAMVAVLVRHKPNVNGQVMVTFEAKQAITFAFGDTDKASFGDFTTLASIASRKLVELIASILPNGKPLPTLVFMERQYVGGKGANIHLGLRLMLVAQSLCSAITHIAKATVFDVAAQSVKAHYKIGNQKSYAETKKIAIATVQDKFGVRMNDHQSDALLILDYGLTQKMKLSVEYDLLTIQKSHAEQPTAVVGTTSTSSTIKFIVKPPEMRDD